MGWIGGVYRGEHIVALFCRAMLGDIEGVLE